MWAFPCGRTAREGAGNSFASSSGVSRGTREATRGLLVPPTPREQGPAGAPQGACEPGLPPELSGRGTACRAWTPESRRGPGQAQALEAGGSVAGQAGGRDPVVFRAKPQGNLAQGLEQLPGGLNPAAHRQGLAAHGWGHQVTELPPAQGTLGTPGDSVTGAAPRRVLHAAAPRPTLRPSSPVPEAQHAWPAAMEAGSREAPPGLGQRLACALRRRPRPHSPRSRRPCVLCKSDP